MKKNLLIFGGNSFLAKEFNKAFGDIFNITNIYRDAQNGQPGFDFEKGDAAAFHTKIEGNFDGVLFFQGLNPSMGAKDITADHFNRMLHINLVMPTLLIKSLAEKLNQGAMVLFISSVAKKKGSYDPSYGSAKAGLTGLVHSLANAHPHLRFNIISLGLVEGSPVYNNMTPDFRQKHVNRMFNNALVKAADVVRMVAELVNNQSINRADIEIDGGYN